MLERNAALEVSRFLEMTRPERGMKATTQEDIVAAGDCQTTTWPPDSCVGGHCD